MYVFFSICMPLHCLFKVRGRSCQTPQTETSWTGKENFFVIWISADCISGEGSCFWRLCWKGVVRYAKNCSECMALCHMRFSNPNLDVRIVFCSSFFQLCVIRSKGSLDIWNMSLYTDICMYVCFQVSHINQKKIKWTQVNPGEPKWTQGNPSESKWTQVNQSEPMCIQVNPREPKSTQVSPCGKFR